MEKEVGEDEEQTKHVQVRRHACAGQTKAFRIGSLLPPGRTEDQIQVVNSAASALPHRDISPVLFLLNFKHISLHLKLASYSP